VHNCQFRVYYEDTDAGGVVYYANYLKFAERARTEYLRDVGINQSELAEKDGILFVVRHVSLDLKKPARLDDMLSINTNVEKIAGASIIMRQEISCGQIDLAHLSVKIACVDTNMRPARLSDNVKSKLV